MLGAIVPIEYSYEVIKDRFYAGEYPRNIDEQSTPVKIRRFVEFEITDFVDLTEDGELLPYVPLLPKNMRHHRFPVPDPGPPKTLEQLYDIHVTIGKLLSGGSKIYVHCWGGINRTGIAVGTWFMYKGMSITDAMAEFELLWMTNPKSGWEEPKIRYCRKYLAEYADFLLSKKL